MRLLFNDEKMDVSSKNGKIVGDSEDMHGWVRRRILAIRVKLVDKKVIFAIRDKLPFERSLYQEMSGST